MNTEPITDQDTVPTEPTHRRALAVTRRHDRATNLWPLALLSMGESWHNTHHSDPTCARHGTDRGQIDLGAIYAPYRFALV